MMLWQYVKPWFFAGTGTSVEGADPTVTDGMVLFASCGTSSGKK